MYISGLKLIQVIIENPWQSLIAGVIVTGIKLLTGVSPKSLTPVHGKHSFANISANFRKKFVMAQWNTQEPGGHCFMKKS